MIDMRDQPFGVEIEMTGITREQAAEVLSDSFPTHTKMYRLMTTKMEEQANT